MLQMIMHMSQKNKMTGKSIYPGADTRQRNLGTFLLTTR